MKLSVSTLKFQGLDWVKEGREIVVEGHRGRGRPQKTLDELDLRMLNMQHELAHNSIKWKFPIK